MSKVFVTNAWGHDVAPDILVSNVSKPIEVDEVIPITKGMIDKYDAAFMLECCNEVLSSAKAEDFLILTGPALLQCFAVSYMLNKFGEVHILQFVKGKYKVRDLVPTKTNELVIQ